jgi:predicted NUDIX family NTP pyrophosphohydrolase
MARPKESAGLLMYRCREGVLDVFIVHPGGPFFARKDEGSWSIPKGEIETGEAMLDVARREFDEETGQRVERCAVGDGFESLGSVLQRGGKRVHAWAFEGDWPRGVPLRSNTFTMEWPRGSGQSGEFPEVDRAEFFSVDVAREKLNPAQAELLDRLLEILR